MYILLLERDPLYCEMTHEMLCRDGLAVLAVGTETKALRFLGRGIDLILIGGCPGGDPALRAMALRLRIPVIRLQDRETASGEDGAEMCCVLHKPFTHPQLLGAVRVVSLRSQGQVGEDAGLSPDTASVPWG